MKFSWLLPFNVKWKLIPFVLVRSGIRYFRLTTLIHSHIFCTVYSLDRLFYFFCFYISEKREKERTNSLNIFIVLWMYPFLWVYFVLSFSNKQWTCAFGVPVVRSVCSLDSLFLLLFHQVRRTFGSTKFYHPLCQFTFAEDFSMIYTPVFWIFN